MAIQIKRISVEEQEAILEKKLDFRIQNAIKVQSDNEYYQINRDLNIDLCKGTKDDPAAGFIYWADNFAFIQHPKAATPEGKNIPFALWDFQEQAAREIIKAVEEGYDLPIEKSREQGLSWLLIAILVWGWHFREWECLVGSQKFENVHKRGNIKSLLEKAIYIIEKLPRWMIPPLIDKKHITIGNINHPVHGAAIAGESNNTNFGRSDRRKVILFDEFSSWEQTDEAAWQACGATTQCRIPLSTPNTRGTNCYFYVICKEAEKKGKPLLHLHWTLNPVFAKGLYYDDLNKPRSVWYDKQCERATRPREVAQELDIDYDASMGDKVYGDFDPDVNISEDAVYQPNLPHYYGWDFGLDTTAILWIQHDRNKDLYYIFDEYEGNGNDNKGGESIYHYIEIVQSKPYGNGIHFGDPQSGENRSLAAGGTSNANILRKHGMRFKSKKTKVVNRIAAARNIISKLRVHPDCALAIDMFKNWQMVKPKTGNTSSQTTRHDEYSHSGEAFSYFAYMYPQRAKGTPPPKKEYNKTLGGISL